MSEETKNLNHTDQKKGEDALKGLSMKERKKALEEKKEKRRTKLYIAIGVVVAILVAALLFFDGGTLQRSMTAMTVGDKTYSAAEVDYYFYSSYNSASTYAKYYGLDTSKSLKDQEIYEGTTWYDYFRDSSQEGADQCIHPGAGGGKGRVQPQQGGRAGGGGRHHRSERALQGEWLLPEILPPEHLWPVHEREDLQEGRPGIPAGTGVPEEGH